MKKHPPVGALLLSIALVCACSDERTSERPGATTLPPAVGTRTAYRPSPAADLPPPQRHRFPPLEPLTDAGADQRGIPHLRTFTSDDGLPLDAFWCGAMDSTGTLWFGSNGGGLVRYDGQAFVHFSLAEGLSDNVIMSLLPGRNGDLWIGTSMGGLMRYDGRSFKSWSDADGLPNRGVISLLEDRNGLLWIGTRRNGLSRWDGKAFTTFTAKDGLVGDWVHDILKAKDGTLWFATDLALCRYDGTRFTAYTAANGMPVTPLQALAEDDNGAVWIGDNKGHLVRMWPGRNGSAPQFKLFDGLLLDAGRINRLQNVRGDIWAVTDGSGAWRLHKESLGTDRLQVSRLTAEQGLPAKTLEDIVVDRAGDIWIATNGGGLVHYRGEAFVNRPGLHVYGIAEKPTGGLWLVTSEGVRSLDSNALAIPSGAFNEGHRAYAATRDHQGRILFGQDLRGSEQVAFSVLDGEDYILHPGAKDDALHYVFWIMRDSRGRVWKAGNGGMLRYDGLDEEGPLRRTRITPAEGLPNNIVLCMSEEPDGDLWFGTDGSGLVHFDGTTFTTYDTDDGLPNNVVWSIVRDAGGNIWCSTFNGVCRFDGTSFLTLGTRDGLSDNTVLQLLYTRPSARNGAALLVGTLNGLTVLNGWRNDTGALLPLDGEMARATNEDLRRFTPDFTVYNAASGYPVKDVEVGQNALMEDRDGIIWIANGSGRTGLVRFDRDALPARDERPPHVLLRRLLIKAQPVPWYTIADSIVDPAILAQQEVACLGRVLQPAERETFRERFSGLRFSGVPAWSGLPSELVLDHAHNQVSFAFCAVETAQSQVVEYQYMLEGYDDAWSPVTRSTTAIYGNINEGNYTFRVKAKSASGVWSEPAAYSFTVLPPWYRTWWAYAAFLLTVAVIVLLYIRVRLSALRRQKERLERTVAERTEELRHQKDEADRQRDRAEFSEKAKERFLANVSHEIRTPMNAIMGMSDILRNRPHAPEQEKYLHAIAQSSENLLVIINDILDLSKIDAGRIELESVPFAPREVLGNVKDVLQLKADEKGLALALTVAPSVPERLVGDPTRLNQIVMNLCGNAIKFTERGGVRIEAHSEAIDDRTWLAIEVIDSGIGIPEDRLEKIFEEFTQAYSDTTRKYGGTGLGLTISRRLAQLQGGSLTARSERDKGSTFTVRIPYRLA